MAEVYFVDTSVLLNLLDVPQRNQDRAEVTALFKERVRAGAILVIPAATIIETGNLIAQLADGGARRDRATRLAGFLTAAAEGRAPWTVVATEWSGEFLQSLVDGGGTAPSLADLAMQGVGAGDACILRELAAYRSRVPSGLTLSVWTLDAGLAAHA